MAKPCFVVLRNADFTEGRGPMVLDEVFTKFEVANDYVMSKGGIFGSQQRQDHSLSRPGRWYYNGYEIIEKLLLTETFKQDFDTIDRAAALKKLSQRERELLGL